MGFFRNNHLDKKIEELKSYVDSRFRQQQREIEAKRYFLPKEDEFKKRLSDLVNEIQEASINIILERLFELEKKQNELQNFMQKKLKKNDSEKRQKSQRAE